ncbi:MAG: hypothetical protein CL878_07330 [Dehalococcoidia bacterium]|nr:hypothetical protein [Dehalococcoidia bacterium]
MADTEQAQPDVGEGSSFPQEGAQPEPAEGSSRGTESALQEPPLREGSTDDESEAPTWSDDEIGAIMQDGRVVSAMESVVERRIQAGMPKLEERAQRRAERKVREALDAERAAAAEQSLLARRAALQERAAAGDAGARNELAQDLLGQFKSEMGQRHVRLQTEAERRRLCGSYLDAHGVNPDEIELDGAEDFATLNAKVAGKATSTEFVNAFMENPLVQARVEQAVQQASDQARQAGFNRTSTGC